MLVIGIIILLISGISLYDYFSSKNWNQVTSSQRNEVVFEERNHAYGAYQIRKNYSLNVILVTLGVTLAIGTAFGIYKIVQSLPDAATEEVEVNTQMFAADAEEPEEPLEPLEPEVPPMEKTIQFLPPVVSDDEPENTPPTDEELDKTDASTQTNPNETDPFGNNTPPPPPKKDPPVEEKKVEILDFVDEQALFPGGPDAMRKFIAENINYPQTAIEMGYQGKCYLRFVVSDEGYISNVKVQKGVTDCPECDKEAIRVVKSMPRWTPGKNNGKAVNSYFTLPVTFKLNG